MLDSLLLAGALPRLGIAAGAAALVWIAILVAVR